MRIVAPAISITSPRLSPGVSDSSAATAASRSHSGFERDRESGHGVLRVMRAEKMEIEGPFVFARAKMHVQAGDIFRATSRICGIGARTDAEVDDLPVEIAAELRDIRVGAVEERDAVGGQRGDQFEFGARDAGLALGEILDVRGADVGDDAPVGRGDAGEGCDFAQVVHAHLDDGILVLGLEAKELQRQAEGIVEIAMRFEYVEFCARARRQWLPWWWSCRQSR